MKKLIAIEGNIGVGKTTLARFLSTQFDAGLLRTNCIHCSCYNYRICCCLSDIVYKST